MDRLAGLFERRMFLFVVFVVALSGFAGRGLSKLSFNDVPREIFASDDEDFARLLELYDQFGSDDNDVLVVLECADWFTPETAGALHELHEGLEALGSVDGVFSMARIPDFSGGGLPRPLLPRPGAPAGRYELAREASRHHPLVSGLLLSRDGRTALCMVRLAGGALGIEEILSAMVEVTGVVNPLEARRPDLSVRMTGVPLLRVDIYRSIRFEQKLFTALGALVCAILGWFLFRSPRAVIAVTLPPAVGAIWALGAIGLVGREIDILGTVLPTLVIVIGFTDCVHLMIDVRISRGSGLSPRKAAGDAIRHVGLPCALTSLTTAIGFGSLSFSDIPAIRAFGELAGLAVIVAFTSIITLMPLMVALLRDVGVSSAEDGARPGTGGWPGRLIDTVLAHKKVVTVGGLSLCVGLLALGTRLRPENRLTESLPRGEAYQALVHCQDVFGGILPAYAVVEWGEGTSIESAELRSLLAEIEELLDAQGTGRPSSVLSLLRSVPGGEENPRRAIERLPPEAVRGFLREDLGKAVVAVPVPDEGRESMDVLFGNIQAGLAELEARHPDVELYLSGTDFVARSNINRMIVGLARSLGVAALLILLVIALEYRSWFLGLVSLVPNLFPLVLVAGVLALAGVPLQMGSAVLFSVLLGLAVDDTIHFLSRLRRERRKGIERMAALRSTFLTVGKAIAITTVILMAGFGVVVFSEVPTNRLFALLLGTGLLGALLGDLILLPAMVAWWGKGRVRG